MSSMAELYGLQCVIKDLPQLLLTPHRRLLLQGDATVKSGPQPGKLRRIVLLSDSLLWASIKTFKAKGWVSLGGSLIASSGVSVAVRPKAFIMPAATDDEGVVQLLFARLADCDNWCQKMKSVATDGVTSVQHITRDAPADVVREKEQPFSPEQPSASEDKDVLPVPAIHPGEADFHFTKRVGLHGVQSASTTIRVLQSQLLRKVHRFISFQLKAERAASTSGHLLASAKEIVAHFIKRTQIFSGKCGDAPVYHALRQNPSHPHQFTLMIVCERAPDAIDGDVKLRAWCDQFLNFVPRASSLLPTRCLELKPVS